MAGEARVGSVVDRHKTPLATASRVQGGHRAGTVRACRLGAKHMALLRRLRPAVALAVLCAALCPSDAVAQRSADEEHIKAVFLFNFAKYVDWPDAPPGTS